MQRPTHLQQWDFHSSCFQSRKQDHPSMHPRQSTLYSILFLRQMESQLLKTRRVKVKTWNFENCQSWQPYNHRPDLITRDILPRCETITTWANIQTAKFLLFASEQACRIARTNPRERKRESQQSNALYHSGNTTLPAGIRQGQGSKLLLCICRAARLSCIASPASLHSQLVRKTCWQGTGSCSSSNWKQQARATPGTLPGHTNSVIKFPVHIFLD